jgi:hypothetical protein
METAVGPMATEFRPTAVLSAAVELVWKYLIPAPFTSALTVERPVESEATPLALVLMPDEADVEREPTLLMVVDRPLEAEVESDPT